MKKMDDLDSKINYLNFVNDFEINIDERSKILFGCNGIGKSSLYAVIKEQHPEFSYIDYDDMRNTFISIKKSDVEISTNVNEIENLQNDLKSIVMNNALKERFNKFDITRKHVAKEISEQLGNIFANKDKSLEGIDTIKITKQNFEALEKLELIEQKFIVNNYNELKKIDNYENQIDKLKNDYLSNVLDILDKNINADVTICPICGTGDIVDLKQIIADKRVQADRIKNEKIKQYRSLYPDLCGKVISEKFANICEIISNTTETDIIDFIVCGGEKQNKKKMNESLLNYQNKKKAIASFENQRDIFYNNLKNKEQKFIAYLKNKFNIVATFDDTKRAVSIKMERKPAEYSTGEINLILFTTKIFEYIGSSNTLIVLDDPISSYDLVNQYKIIYDIISNVSNDATNQKQFLIFTHNIDMINILNTQFSGAFHYEFLEKIDNTLYLKSIDFNDRDSLLNIENLISNNSTNINTQYIDLLIKREDMTKEFVGHKIFHYDEPYSFDDAAFPKYMQLNNDFLVEFIDRFDERQLTTFSFSELCIVKIMILLSIRVWIEHKFYTELTEDNILKERETFVDKINYVLPRNGNSLLPNYAKLTRESLMCKKVMLNQNEHYKSQIEPFYYALNVSIDDLQKEIIEIKELFL